MNYFFKTQLICIFCSIVTVLCSCHPKAISDPAAYLAYLADKQHGLSKEKTVSGIRFKVKYLPAEYLAYNSIKEIQGISDAAKDSIVKTYDHSIAFLLNIGPAEKQSFDITKVGVTNYAEFAQRIELMAFEAQNWITMRYNNTEEKPVITRMETINALENSRNFIVVFNSEKNTDKDLTKTDLCFVYNDELFTTGISKFMFKAEDLQELPAFTY